jgi:hypothetical protein
MAVALISIASKDVEIGELVSSVAVDLTANPSKASVYQVGNHECVGSGMTRHSNDHQRL